MGRLESLTVYRREPIPCLGVGEGRQRLKVHRWSAPVDLLSYAVDLRARNDGGRCTRSRGEPTDDDAVNLKASGIEHVFRHDSTNFCQTAIFDPKVTGNHSEELEAPRMLRRHHP